MKINKRKAASYFRNHFYIRRSTNGYYRFSDPFDKKSDDSMSVNFSADVVRGFRSKYVSDIATFIQNYENLQSGAEVTGFLEGYEESDYSEVTRPVQQIPDEYVANWPEHFIPFDIPNNRVIRYVEGRGFNYDNLLEKSFGYCLKGKYANRLIIPVFVDQHLKYWQAGALSKRSYPKYLFPSADDCVVGKSQVLYNQDLLLYHRKIYVTEGWSDAETMGNGIGTFGWKISTTQWRILRKHFKHLNEIVVIADEGFYEYQVRQWMKFCREVKIKVLNLDNEGDKADANSLGKERIYEIEEQTNYLQFTDILDQL